MDSLDSIEYGVASNLQYKITIDHVNPATNLPLQPSDLYVTLYIKSDLDSDAVLTITGVYNDDDEAFDFSFTEEQAKLLTVGTWYYGFEVRITDINGLPVYKHTYVRKVVKTGAKV